MRNVSLSRIAPRFAATAALMPSRTVSAFPTENSNAFASWMAAVWLPKKARTSRWIDRASVV